MPTDSWGSNSKVHISNVMLGNQTKCRLWFLFKMGVNSKKGWICWHALENQETTSAGFNYARFFPLLMGWRFSSVTNSTSFCLVSYVLPFWRWGGIIGSGGGALLLSYAPVILLLLPVFWMELALRRSNSFANVETFLTKLLIFCRTF